MKRQRGRGGGGHNNNNMNRKPGNHPNRSFDSNGPDVKVRGPASHIYEKYLQLARDATSAGDRVMAENFLQHAEHYFRVMRAMQPAAPPPQLHDRFGEDVDFDGEGETSGAEAAEAEAGERTGEHQGREPRPDYQQREYREGRGDQPREPRGDYQPREFREPREPREPREHRGEGEGGQPGEEGEGFRRNNRRRRNRFRVDGERAPRGEGDGGEAAPEGGFGDSLPAFLGNE